MKERISSSEVRILLWVIRHTLGWNRATVAFSWYRIARDLRLDRAGVLRAGKRLLASGWLSSDGGSIGLRDAAILVASWATAPHAASMQTTDTSNVDHAQRSRCVPSPYDRRDKDIMKKTIKEKQDRSAPQERTPNPATQPRFIHHAGAATPVPGKYDSIS